MRKVQPCAGGLMAAFVAVFASAGVNAQELGSISFPTSGSLAAQPQFIEGVEADVQRPAQSGIGRARLLRAAASKCAASTGER